MNKQDLIYRLKETQHKFVDVTHQANEVLRLNGELTTLKEYLDKHIEQRKKSIYTFDPIETDDIFFELPENADDLPGFCDNYFEAPISYEVIRGLVLDKKDVVGAFLRREVANPLSILNIKAEKILPSFKEKKMELESYLKEKYAELNQEKIEHIKQNLHYPEVATQYLNIQINPEYFFRLRQSTGFYKEALKQHIHYEFNPNQRKKFKNFVFISQNFDVAHIMHDETFMPLKIFLFSRIGEAEKLKSYELVFKQPYNGQEIIRKGEISDSILSVIDPKNDKIIGFIYSSELKHSFPQYASSLSLLNNLEEELHLAQAKLYLDKKVRMRRFENKYAWCGFFDPEYVSKMAFNKDLK